MRFAELEFRIQYELKLYIFCKTPKRRLFFIEKDTLKNLVVHTIIDGSGPGQNFLQKYHMCTCEPCVKLQELPGN